MSETFILIPGRTSKQGVGINEGKYGETYLGEITKLQVAPGDMERLGITDGDWVRLIGEHGTIDVEVISAKKDELPEGLLFIAYGDLSSQACPLARVWTLSWKPFRPQASHRRVINRRVPNPPVAK